MHTLQGVAVPALSQDSVVCSKCGGSREYARFVGVAGLMRALCSQPFHTLPLRIREIPQSLADDLGLPWLGGAR